MSEVSLEKLVVTLLASLRSILATIEVNGLGLVFVVDEQRRLLGSITDGDIRRAMLTGVGVDDTITLSSSIHNISPHALPVDSRIHEI